MSYIGDEITSGRIVEVEGYLSENDPSAHSARGPTPRTQIQWGPPGFTYVYLIYGMYYCMNFVTEDEGVPGCALIRALEPLEGFQTMYHRRAKAKNNRSLCNGPGKLTMALGITKEHNGCDLTQGVVQVTPGIEIQDEWITATPRIGMSDGNVLPYRYIIKDNDFVSK